MPVARYTFNKRSLTDEISKMAARAYGSSIVEDRFGNPESARFLHGNYSSYINLGSSPHLKPEAGSISLWVRIDHAMFNGTGIEINPIIFTRAHPGEDHNEAYFMGYDFNTKNINGCVSLNELMTEAIYTSQVTLRKWHHLVCTYDDHFFCLYLDGILENKMMKNFKTTFLSNDSVLVGIRTSKKNNRFLNGCVDDIEIYNRVLSPSEVMQLYHAPNPDKSRIVLKWVVIGMAIVAGILLLALLFRFRINKLMAAEKQKNELRNHWYEQENRVLTAQMDPHFIFNSLNTIQQFILVSENEKAQLYLSKFSKLLRSLLESNTKASVSLKDEIEMFERYQEIESLRFNTIFNHKTIIKGDIDPTAIQIPHFLIQPFIENAIWHGLLPMNGERHLHVSFEQLDERTLGCTIDDNGVGRKNARLSSLYSNKKSLAINFIQQRLQLMSKINKASYTVEIIDKVNHNGEAEGTRIHLKIPILKN